jgi:IS4 transposase
MVKFKIRNSREEEASFGLMIYRKKKKDAKETDPIPDQYIVFATNMKYSEARKLYRKIPLEYKKRWGIETGFRVQNMVKAMTTSRNYTIRIVYQMLSVIIYNLWQLANILLALELMVKLEDPLIKLTHLARIFRLEIEMPSWQHQ